MEGPVFQKEIDSSLTEAEFNDDTEGEFNGDIGSQHKETNDRNDDIFVDGDGIIRFRDGFTVPSVSLSQSEVDNLDVKEMQQLLENAVSASSALSSPFVCCDSLSLPEGVSLAIDHTEIVTTFKEREYDTEQPKGRSHVVDLSVLIASVRANHDGCAAAADEKPKKKFLTLLSLDEDTGANTGAHTPKCTSLTMKVVSCVTDSTLGSFLLPLHCNQHKERECQPPSLVVSIEFAASENDDCIVVLQEACSSRQLVRLCDPKRRPPTSPSLSQSSSSASSSPPSSSASSGNQTGRPCQRVTRSTAAENKRTARSATTDRHDAKERPTVGIRPKNGGKKDRRNDYGKDAPLSRSFTQVRVAFTSFSCVTVVSCHDDRLYEWSVPVSLLSDYDVVDDDTRIKDDESRRENSIPAIPCRFRFPLPDKRHRDETVSSVHCFSWNGGDHVFLFRRWEGKKWRCFSRSQQRYVISDASLCNKVEADRPFMMDMVARELPTCRTGIDDSNREQGEGQKIRSSLLAVSTFSTVRLLLVSSLPSFERLQLMYLSSPSLLRVCGSAVAAAGTARIKGGKERVIAAYSLISEASMVERMKGGGDAVMRFACSDEVDFSMFSSIHGRYRFLILGLLGELTCCFFVLCWSR